MRRAIIVFGGFTEQWDDNTGQDQLYQKILPLAVMHSHDDVVLVFKREWHKWKELVNWLNANNVSEAFVCAYSWGAGLGLREFAKRFLGGITCVLCDPVFRSKYPWMRWRALRKKQNVIKLSDNVNVKRVFYQEMDEPGNDLVKGVDKRTRLAAPHTKIDEHPAYHEAAIKEIKQWLQPR